MPVDDAKKSSLSGIAHGTRPNAKSFLQISGDNPYTKLGVSPLAPTAEISLRINTLLAEARRRILAKGAKVADDPDEKDLLMMQQIDKEIGDPKRRKQYDETHPQNILLTVQPSASEKAWQRYRRSALISEWIWESLRAEAPAGYGEQAFVPTHNCLRLWAPSGIGTPEAEFLGAFEAETASRKASTDASARMPEADPAKLTVSYLESIIAKEEE